MRLAGVDGCEAGWMVAMDSGRGIALAIVETVDEYLETMSCDRLVIDIPI